MQHSTGASTPARPYTSAASRPDAAAHVTLSAPQGSDVTARSGARDQQQGPRQAVGHTGLATWQQPSTRP
eukprot:scaffold1794_cov21-Tisochrysis_lutea.AAC.1